ncbi:hypothetical protein DY000_02035673 [Brassica cretica]|uniref:Uncharacterized protein n=1 Tax=Brassica cretica TaxID=69181 RepID=A0ABQ7DBX5_BRACR|nr:hypothetical protein DY000_02035673 [Brassica cretica]
MKNLHFNAIIFASDDHDLIGAVSKPSAWPSLKFYSSHLLAWLQHIVDWKVHFHSHQHIIGAKLIARSVIKEELFQSYIAVVAGLNYRYSPRIYLTYGTVDISNSYAIPHNESSDQVPLNFTPNYEFCFSSNGPCIKGVIGFTPNNNSLHSFKSFMLISVWLRLRELDDQLLLMYLPTIKHNKDTVESS